MEKDYRDSSLQVSWVIDGCFQEIDNNRAHDPHVACLFSEIFLFPRVLSVYFSQIYSNAEPPLPTTTTTTTVSSTVSSSTTSSQGESTTKTESTTSEADSTISKTDSTTISTSMITSTVSKTTARRKTSVITSKSSPSPTELPPTGKKFTSLAPTATATRQADHSTSSVPGGTKIRGGKFTCYTCGTISN